MQTLRRQLNLIQLQSRLNLNLRLIDHSLEVLSTELQVNSGELVTGHLLGLYMTYVLRLA